MAFPYSSGDVLTAADLNASSGLVLVKTQSIGSGVSSVTVTGAFSATFDNYRIVADCPTSGSATGYLKFGSATTGYYWAHINCNTSGTVGTDGGANDSSFGQVTVGRSTGFIMLVDVGYPFLTERTTINSFGSDTRTTSPTPLRYTGGFLNDATSYTAFTLEVSNMSGGTIRVYGYNNG